jgi:hypothetical protein
MEIGLKLDEAVSAVSKIAFTSGMSSFRRTAVTGN